MVDARLIGTRFRTPKLQGAVHGHSKHYLVSIHGQLATL